MAIDCLSLWLASIYYPFDYRCYRRFRGCRHLGGCSCVEQGLDHRGELDRFSPVFRYHRLLYFPQRAETCS